MHNAEFFSNQGNLSFTPQKYTYGYIFMNQPIQLVLSDCIHSQKFCFSGDSGFWVILKVHVHNLQSPISKVPPLISLMLRNCMKFLNLLTLLNAINRVNNQSTLDLDPIYKLTFVNYTSHLKLILSALGK